MRTWLVIVRGDPLDPVPIGICREPEIVIAAIRGAWREWQELTCAHASDAVLREGIEGMEGRLRVAVAELEREAGVGDAEVEP